MKNLFKNNAVVIFAVGVLTGVCLTILLQEGSALEQEQNYSRGNSVEVPDEDDSLGSHDAEGSQRIKNVIDGDTVDLVSGERVRLIGIDTPERGKLFYNEATEELRSLVEGRDIRLVKDVSAKDRYGRLLRHIYVGDVWVNAEMIKRGYARVVTYPPDVMHVDTFTSLEREAIDQKRGLWHNGYYQEKD